MDDAVEIEGYDGAVDDSPSYSPSPGRKSSMGAPRRGGRKNLSPPGGRGSRHAPMRRSFGGGFSPGKLAGSVSSMLVIAVVGVIAVAGVLYYTFSSGSYPAGLSQFYGALAAAVVFVVLLAYVLVRLLGSGE